MYALWIPQEIKHSGWKIIFASSLSWIAYVNLRKKLCPSSTWYQGTGRGEEGDKTSEEFACVTTKYSQPLLRLSTTPPTLPQFLIKQVLKGPGPQYQTSQSGRPWREKGIQYPVNLLYCNEFCRDFRYFFCLYGINNYFWEVMIWNCVEIAISIELSRFTAA